MFIRSQAIETIMAFLSLASIFVVVALALFVFALVRLYPKGKVDGIHKKYVLITGCDSGFGKETAISLDKLGFHVFASCLTKAGEENLRSACSERLQTLHLDVTRSDEIRAVFEQIKERLPANAGLWGLVNNAGIAKGGPLEWIPVQDFKRIADVNLWGLIDVTKTFLPLLKKSKGRVVNMASVLARVVPPYISAYSVSKFGVEAFSDALRREISPWAVQVSIIEPGLFKTDLSANVEAEYRAMWENLSSELKQEYDENYLKQQIKGIQRVMASGNPDTYKVADAVVDALTSLRPHTRYLVGSDAFVLMLLAVLPTCVSDYILCRRLNLKQVT